MAGPIHIGCSGWQYAAWKGRFYPEDLPVADWLDYYTARFDTVEINNTFYRLPERDTFQRWANSVPRDFLIAIKSSGYLTHRKRLREPEEPVERLFSRASALGRHLGPVLYQLPSSLRYDYERLEHLLSILPRRIGRRLVSHVMEFRDRSWYRDDVFDLLNRHGVTLCLHDKLGSEWHDDVIGPFVYVRFHGTSGHYHGSYPERHLRGWADRFVRWSSDGLPVYAYFNNDPDATAVRNAQTLMAMVKRGPT